VVGSHIKCFDFCLRVGEWSRSIGPTQGRANRRFLGGRGVPSSEPRASQNVVETFRSSFWLALSLWAELLAWFSQEFVSFDR
jgi:hypothetical protein